MTTTAAKPNRVVEWIDTSHDPAAEWLRINCKKETRFKYLRRAVNCYVCKEHLDGDLKELYLVVEPGETRVYLSDGISEDFRVPFGHTRRSVHGIAGAVQFMRGVLAAYRRPMGSM